MRIPWPGLASGWGTVTPAGALHTDGLTGCPRAPCCRLFLCLWALQVGGMLVAPRLLAARVLPRIAASPLLQCRAPEQPLASTPRAAAASGSATGAAGRALHATLAYLAWPLAALFLCASVTGGPGGRAGGAALQVHVRLSPAARPWERATATNCPIALPTLPRARRGVGRPAGLQHLPAAGALAAVHGPVGPPARRHVPFWGAGPAGPGRRPARLALHQHLR